MSKLNSLTGISGTYYAAAELSKREYIALVTMKNTSGVDILVSSEISKKSIVIQVKTSKLAHKKGYTLKNKDEELKSDDLVYIFVNMKDGNFRPDFYIVPSEIVAKTISDGHKKWSGEKGKRGQIRDGSSRIRKFYPSEEKDKENWKVIAEKLNSIPK
ncbi:MAG: aspartate ammonia-lyase [Candidatus Aminicenantes bacterium]|nr:aspartate ammonia-lyase [Candidatus Aminicenantes bacterium]